MGFEYNENFYDLRLKCIVLRILTASTCNSHRDMKIQPNCLLMPCMQFPQNDFENENLPVHSVDTETEQNPAH